MKQIETTEELEQAINLIDWQELHKTRTHHDYGMQVWLYWDGEKKVHESIQTQGTIPGKHNAAFAFFHCGLDTMDYEEGWAEELEDGSFHTDDGLVVSEAEMIDKAIDEGDFSDAYEDWKEEIRREWSDHRNIEY